MDLEWRKWRGKSSEILGEKDWRVRGERAIDLLRSGSGGSVVLEMPEGWASTDQISAWHGRVLVLR